MVGPVEAMLKLHKDLPKAKTPHEQESLQRQIAATDKQIDALVLTVHGTKDMTVPYDQAIRLDWALKKAGVPSYFVTVRGAGHGDFGTVADPSVKMFFDKHKHGQDVQVSTEPLDKP